MLHITDFDYQISLGEPQQKYLQQPGAKSRIMEVA